MVPDAAILGIGDDDHGIIPDEAVLNFIDNLCGVVVAAALRALGPEDISTRLVLSGKSIGDRFAESTIEQRRDMLATEITVTVTAEGIKAEANHAATRTGAHMGEVSILASW